MSCTLTVMGKGRKERSVPFSAKTCQALLEYSRLRAQTFPGAIHFFVGRTGKSLDRFHVRKKIRRYGKKARHYVHLARRDIAEQHKKFSPMEGLLGREMLKKQARNLPSLMSQASPITA